MFTTMEKIVELKFNNRNVISLKLVHKRNGQQKLASGCLTSDIV